MMARRIYHPQELDELSRQSRKIYKINNDITLHLVGSIIQLLKYGEKYSIKIPKKEQLEQILINTQFLLKEHSEVVQQFNDTISYFNSDQPTGNTNKNYRRGNRTPKIYLYILSILIINSRCILTRNCYYYQLHILVKFLILILI